MSTKPRDEGHVAVLDQPEVQSSGNVKACVACDQEMVCDEENWLPLHMASGRFCIGSMTEGAASKGGARIIEPLTIEGVAQLSVSEIASVDMCLSCGRSKRPGQPLCTGCHGVLPLAHQKALPSFIHGFLLIDEKKTIEGLSKNQFMEVFQTALEWLARLRAESRERRQQSN